LRERQTPGQKIDLSQSENSLVAEKNRP